MERRYYRRRCQVKFGEYWETGTLHYGEFNGAVVRRVYVVLDLNGRTTNKRVYLGGKDLKRIRYTD